MTNYNNDTLELIPGNTPKEKYDWVKAQLDRIKAANNRDEAITKAFNSLPDSLKTK
jgi:hypothetical protein